MDCADKCTSKCVCKLNYCETKPIKTYGIVHYGAVHRGRSQQSTCFPLCSDIRGLTPTSNQSHGSIVGVSGFTPSPMVMGIISPCDKSLKIHKIMPKIIGPQIPPPQLFLSMPLLLLVKPGPKIVFSDTERPVSH